MFVVAAGNTVIIEAAADGLGLGLGLGLGEGDGLGATDGEGLGTTEGEGLGTTLGDGLGDALGITDGTGLGTTEGDGEGSTVDLREIPAPLSFCISQPTNATVAYEMRIALKTLVDKLFILTPLKTDVQIEYLQQSEINS